MLAAVIAAGIAKEIAVGIRLSLEAREEQDLIIFFKASM